MADIFFSYAQEDRPRIEPLVRLLESHGFSVWWDPKIIPGEEFADVIRTALDEASCVIVAWSAQSLISPWVKDEAVAGRDRGILVPISLDGSKPPLGFGQVATLAFAGWDGDAGDPRIADFMAGVQRLVAASGGAKTAGAPIPVAQVSKQHTGLRQIGMLAATAAAGLVALWVAAHYAGMPVWWPCLSACGDGCGRVVLEIKSHANGDDVPKDVVQLRGTSTYCATCRNVFIVIRDNARRGWHVSFLTQVMASGEWAGSLYFHQLPALGNYLEISARVTAHQTDYGNYALLSDPPTKGVGTKSPINVIRR